MAECIKSIKAGSLCVIGRLTSSDVIITHKSISGKHCVLELEVVDTTEDFEHRGRKPRRLQCAIVDHSSNGTWVLFSKDPTNPILLVKHRKTTIDVGDIIMLLAPGHPESTQYRYVLEGGIREDEVVLCKALLLPHRTLSKRANVVRECGVPSKKFKQSEDLGNHSQKFKVLRKAEMCDTIVPIASTPITSVPIIAMHVHAPVTSIQSKSTSAYTSSVSVTSVAPIDLMVSTVSDVPALSRELSQEECPKCYHLFNVIDLVSHVSECNPSVLPKEEEEEDHCCYCLKLFPISELVVHASSCQASIETLLPTIPEKAETSTLAASDSVITSSLPPASIPMATPIVPASPSVVPPLSRVLSKEQCPKCARSFNVVELVSHVTECNPPLPPSVEEEDHCQYCLNLFPISQLVPHASSCSERRASSSSIVTKVYIDDADGADPLERCMLCFCDFPLSKLVLHAQNCEGEMLGSKERFKEFLPSAHEVGPLALSVLTPTQQRAVDYVRECSKAEASNHYPDLCMRVIRLGYSPKDLQRVLQWVRHDAPIIIHMKVDHILSHLVKDTHYRNLFEIGSSGGLHDYTARKGWEDNIFNRIYHSSPHDERVKYGVLNIVGDPSGVRCCYSYGDSFLQLKKVRLRTTFASMDTSSSSVKLSCCEHYGNVLNEYSDPELQAILDVATRKKPYLKSTMITHYKEVQIHGPVCLSENVDCIVVNARHRGNHTLEHMLDEFVRINGCNLIWMDRDSDHGTGSVFGMGGHDSSY